MGKELDNQFVTVLSMLGMLVDTKGLPATVAKDLNVVMHMMQDIRIALQSRVMLKAEEAKLLDSISDPDLRNSIDRQLAAIEAATEAGCFGIKFKL